jgi:hypothetical protein
MTAGFAERLIMLGLRLLVTLIVVFVIARKINLDFSCDFVGVDAFCPAGLRKT